MEYLQSAPAAGEGVDMDRFSLVTKLANESVEELIGRVKALRHPSLLELALAMKLEQLQTTVEELQREKLVLLGEIPAII